MTEIKKEPFNKKEYNLKFSKEYYKKHKVSYWQKYYAKNRERILNYSSEYNKIHRKERAEKQRLRRQTKKVRKKKPNFSIHGLTIYFD